MKNITHLGRHVRLLLGIALLEAAFFWLAGTPRATAYVLAAVMLLTSALGVCPLYRVLGIGAQTRSTSKRILAVRIGAILLPLLLLVGGSYASEFFTRKIFMEEFNGMNHFYKQTLFLTGKGERDKAISNLEQLHQTYQKFQEKYTEYQPFALRQDTLLTADLANVAHLINAVNDPVKTGNLQQAHLDLEKVRPVFQDMFKRNGFSMLSVALVDFHDVMEKMLDAANAKNPEQTMGIYPTAHEKLQAIEAEANDVEIQAIRKNLDALLTLAKEGQKDSLPAQSEQLKSSFVKVYLKRG